MRGDRKGGLNMADGMAHRQQDQEYQRQIETEQAQVRHRMAQSS